MWVFTKYGFISAVEHRDNPELVMVRARDENSINHLADNFGLKVTKTESADYLYRVTMTRTQFEKFLKDYARHELSYDNFKDSIINVKFHDACIDVWKVMYDFQNKP